MRILVIEDEYKLADLIRDYLEKEKYAVDIALDGEDGLFRAEAEIYDVIILDIMLPKMDGFEVLRRIRMKDSKVAILILTAKSELEDKLQGLDMGADDYMAKPFEIKELAARLRVLLRRMKKLEDDVLIYHDLRLDCNQYKLSCNRTNEEVVLGSKEYLLMEYLITNESQILSKEQITDKIWGYNNSVEYNNAEVYVSFLRKKLCFIHSEVKIKTMRGLGYCLAANKN
ncbi:response regulator transcription factor [Konateibacter massiliensis]|uniref:response regulator transcription factor n=1 Tax=Konateibacter massiliensis TaxID=2002841 RepID=UPI000C1523F3|nr:response regulator transcription factor [Konateibacter massiliensis]